MGHGGRKRRCRRHDRRRRGRSKNQTKYENVYRVLESRCWTAAVCLYVWRLWLSYGSSSVAVPVTGRRRCRRFEAFSVLPQYVDCGDCTWVCEFCGAFFWYVERAVNLSTSAHLRYNHCCRGGSVVLPYPSRFPPYFVALYGWKRESFHSTTTLLLPLPMTNTKPW